MIHRCSLCVLTDGWCTVTIWFLGFVTIWFWRFVIPAQAGIQIAALDSRLRGNDTRPLL